MAYFRVKKNRDYTSMSNYHLKDMNLSLKAIGLLSKMLSLPDDWDYSVNGLVAINKESKSAIQSALKELEECGYLVRTKTHDEHGRIGYVYDVYEEPRKETPWTEKPMTEKPMTEKPPQLNTNISNTKELSTKELSTKEYIKKETCKEKKRFVPPTLEEIKEYVFENNLNIDCEYFFDYYNSNGWMVGRNHMKNWKATLRNWSRKNAKSVTRKKSDIEEWLEIGARLDEQERNK